MKKRTLFTLMLGAQVLILQAQTAVNPWQITLGANAVEFYERGGTQYQTGNDGIQFDNKINYSKYLSYLEVSRFLGREFHFMSEGLLTKLIESLQIHLRIQTCTLVLIAVLPFHRRLFWTQGT